MERHHNRYKVRNYICLVKSSVEYKFQSLILYGEALAMQRGGSILLEMNLCIVARSPNSELDLAVNRHAHQLYIWDRFHLTLVFQLDQFWLPKVIRPLFA